jgi:hypothetical protein
MLLIFWNVSIDVLKKKYKKSKVYNIKKWKLKKMRLYINWRRRNSLVVVLYKRQFHFRSCVCWGSYGGVSSISSNLSLVSCLRIIQILHHRFQKQTSFCSFSLLFIYYFFFSFHFILFFFEFFKVQVKGFIVWYVVMLMSLWISVSSSSLVLFLWVDPHGQGLMRSCVFWVEWIFSGKFWLCFSLLR